MPPRKTVNKINHVGESSIAANKRRRIQFRNPPQTTTNVGTDLNFSPPSPMSHQDEEEEVAVDDELISSEVAVDDELISSLIPQQNFIINYHVNSMQQSVEQFWTRKISKELKKIKEIETKLKGQEEQADLFRSMYYYYEQRSFHLEEALRQSTEGERYVSVGPNEEVQSCLVDPKKIAQRMDMKCKNCRKRPATMIWLPCMHLCVCLMCERKMKICPICGVSKTESFMINPPLP